MNLLIVGNWKMNPLTVREAKQLFDGLKRGLKKNKNTEVVICPPFIYLPILHGSIPVRGYGAISFGSQDCFWEEKGAFTGEISPPMLKNLGIKYVIVGHSERRRYFGETDEMINKKLKAAIRVGLNPILCIGETEKERKSGKTNQIVKKQLINGLKGIRYPISIAYEPVWAIGTGNSCSVEDAGKALLFIQNTLAGIYNGKIAGSIRILYGGSVNSKNAADYLKKAGMQGLLVGGASLDAVEFIKIIKSCAA